MERMFCKKCKVSIERLYKKKLCLKCNSHMKLVFDEESDDITIINPTEEERESYGFSYGHDDLVLSEQHIQALIDGKMLAYDGGEYTTFIVKKQELSSEKILSKDKNNSTIITYY
jgi:hypothetical protein